MKIKILFLLTLVSLSCFGQSNMKIGKGFTVEIPEWLNVKTDDNILWGGTLPAVEGIENAILIKTFERDEFKSFEDFQYIFITGNKFGKQSLYSSEHIWYGRNEYDFKTIEHGVTSRVFTMYKNLIYHNQFTLLETSKSYLFIQFCSTPETYEINLPKFNKLMEGLKVQ